jgi:PleD family two-component response regulator
LCLPATRDARQSRRRVFALVAPEANLHTAEAVAERLRQAVEEARFPVETLPEPIRVTMSLGVARHSVLI